MSFLQNIDVSIKEIVDDIEKGNYLIPKFQRDFVWKVPDIENLGDSIIRGYPISSMLVMPINGKLNISAGPLKTFGAQKTGHNAYYVLDGQQRLTSIAKIFLGYDDKREYYFDMLAALCDAFPEDNITQIPSIRRKLEAKGSGKFSKIDKECELCRAFDKKGDDCVESREHNRFIRGKEIIENRYGSQINKFLKVFEEISEENRDKYTDYLSGLFGSMGGYGIPITKIGADADLGLVVRVFEKVNTSGKKLTLFDLINAKSFETKKQEYQIGLADFMKEDLIRISSSGKYNVSESDRCFDAKSTQEGKSYGNLARFARSYAISKYLKKNALPNINHTDMLSTEADEWFIGWEQDHDILLSFVSWLGKQNLLLFGISNMTFLEYIAGLVISRPKLLQEPIFMREVKRFCLQLTITNRSFNKTHLDEIMSFMKFGDLILDSYEMEKHKNRIDVINCKLSPEMICSFGYGRQQFKAIMYILYHEKASGRFNIDLTGEPINIQSINEFDFHHIYPKAHINGDHEKIFNSVANFALLNQTSNRFEIKDKLPRTYINQIRNLYPDKFLSILEQNLMLDFLDEKLETALKNRLQKITDILCEYFE